MRVNILQHASDEGPGSILTWAQQHHHEVFIYHPNDFGQFPTADETDMLVVLGSPASPNDDEAWIKQERALIQACLEQHIPYLGICFGGQQLAKVLGGEVKDAPAKEVGWAPVTLQQPLPGMPKQVEVLHWHQQQFTIPAGAELLFSNENVVEQGFMYQRRAIALQFHLEPLMDNLREIVINDGSYAAGSVLGQTPAQIIDHGVPRANAIVLGKLLDFLAQN